MPFHIFCPFNHLKMQHHLHLYSSSLSGQHQSFWMTFMGTLTSRYGFQQHPSRSQSSYAPGQHGAADRCFLAFRQGLSYFLSSDVQFIWVLGAFVCRLLIPQTCGARLVRSSHGSSWGLQEGDGGPRRVRSHQPCLGWTHPVLCGAAWCRRAPGPAARLSWCKRRRINFFQ